MGKVDTKLKAVGVLLADLVTEPEMWREVRTELQGLIDIEDGDLTMVQVRDRVLEIVYGQVERAGDRAGGSGRTRARG